MTRQQRIRWNAEERAAVIRRAQTLLAQNGALSGTVLFKESQECLPVERRREAFGNAVSWLRAEVRKAGPLPSAVNVWRPEASSGELPSRDDQAQPAHAAAATRTGAAMRAELAASPLLDHLVESGVQLVVRILADPRVKAAVSELVAPPAPLEPAAAAPTPQIDATDAEKRRGEFVVVAGCSAAEAKNLAKEVDGTLDVRFWASDEPRERLLELLPDAEIVFGVADGIPKAVESSLSRLGDRYVRHTGGVKGLYRRLAEQAMRQ